MFARVDVSVPKAVTVMAWLRQPRVGSTEYRGGLCGGRDDVICIVTTTILSDSTKKTLHEPSSNPAQTMS
jgi:hypothetical protein